MVTPAVIQPNPCAKGPIPSELLKSQTEIQNNKLIAFSSKFRTVDSWGHSDIYTVEFDGTDLKQLTNYSGDDDMDKWSPDGKQILFGSDRSHQPYEEGEPGYLMEPFKKELFIINIDGSGSRKVTTDSPYYPSRSPDGKYVVYTQKFYDELRLKHGLGDYLSNVFVENISGAYKQDITAKFQPAAFERIDWSPDSKHFAFTGVTEPMLGTYWPMHVYLANADGSNLRRLDEGGAFRDDSDGYQEKTWSSDGKQLAFLTSKGIAIINADGGGFSEYKLENSSYARDIFWLDDNQHLIFTDNNDTLYKITVDFKNLEKLPLATDLDKLLYRMQLLKTQELSDLKQHYKYELSPDGKWLAYLKSGTYPNNQCRQIRIMSTETGESYFILDQQGLIPYLLKHSPNQELNIISVDSVYTSSSFDQLLWSPDSRQLLLTHSYRGLNRLRYQDLFAINLDGTGLRLIMDDVWYPEIQP
jgi:TolB protein